MKTKLSEKQRISLFPVIAAVKDYAFQDFHVSKSTSD